MKRQIIEILRTLITPLYKISGTHFRPLNYFFEKTGVIDPFIRLIENKTPFPTNKKGNNTSKVLFLRMRFVPRMLASELALASILSSKNAECVFAFCNSLFDICNGWDIREKNPRRLCLSCERNNYELSMKIPYRSIFIKDYAGKGPEHENIILSPKDFYTAEDFQDISIDGINIGDEIYQSIIKFTFSSKISNRQTVNDFIKSSIELYYYLKNIFNNEKPDVVIVNCGHIFWYGIAYKILSHMGIRTISYDETNLDTTKMGWIFDDSNPCVDFNWDLEWNEFKNKVLTESETSIIEKHLENRKKYFLYNKNIKTENFNYPQKNNKGILVSLFTNVVWDATLAGMNSVYKNQIDWIKDTIEYFERQGQEDNNLVIRIHPAENGVYGLPSHELVMEELYKWKKDYKPNVYFIKSHEKINSYDLIERSDLVLVYGSNIGLEAVFCNKPVIVSGLPHYKKRGFTIDPVSQKEYLDILQKIVNREIEFSPNLEIAKKYAYMALIDSQLDLNIFVDEHPYIVTDLKFNKFADLPHNLMFQKINEISDWVIRGKNQHSGYLMNYKLNS
ncbi:hypothetical protein [Clostridium sp.]|uniref:capsular polysaccharide export protein, LipB/KpsS family n=1 Tax=Clostridium sp. TaxID=1506 RepID=UPI00283DB0E1|nr:hypothetical protein [Clostridium sp.]MDR3598760.1 hypothetical protein [Clostridium sp.]